MWYTYLIPPIVGGVIGYITNDIAIRMLFRPHKAKYICGIHIPFTPGIIPKEKGRIAEAIGDVISENLMSTEVLERYLLSEEMIGKIRSAVEEYIEKQKMNEESVRTFLSHSITEEEVNTITQSVNGSLTTQMSAKLADPSVGVKVAQLAMDHVADKMSSDGPQSLLAGLGGALGGMGGAAAALVGGNIVGWFLGQFRSPAERFLANSINNMLKSNGHQMISNMIDGEVDTFLDKRVCDLLGDHDEQLAQAVNKVESIYRTVIKEHLPKILESIDISKIVRERINEMDVNETERIILKVMNKELKAIVWLGAGLGLIMGCMEIFIK